MALNLSPTPISLLQLRNQGVSSKKKKSHSSPSFLNFRRRSMAISGKIAVEQVKIPNSVGEMLTGVLDATERKELVVLCHGFRSSKDSNVLTSLSSALLNIGVSTFRFDFSGNGESEGEFQFGNYWKECEDLHSVVLYWNNRGYHVKSVIGHSKGGSVVVLYASKYNDVHLVVNLSGRLKLGRGIKERFGEKYTQEIEVKGFLDVRDKSGKVQYRVSKESLEERLNTDVESAACSIPKECRVLTVHGSGDDVVTVEDAFEFDKLIPTHKLLVLEDADHCFTKHIEELKDGVVGFIQDGLLLKEEAN